MIQSATQMLEDYLSIKFVSQVWDFWMDSFPYSKDDKWWDGTRDGAISMLLGTAKFIQLPTGRIISLDIFNTYQDDGIPIAATLTDFNVDIVNTKGRVSLKIGFSWPTTILRSINGIQLRCTLGFGNAASVPANIKLAVMEQAGFLFEHRGDETRTLPPSVLSLVSQYKEWKV
jgi:uncharacterized phiE125 gp8 family phage protein